MQQLSLPYTLSPPSYSLIFSIRKHSAAYEYMLSGSRLNVITKDGEREKERTREREGKKTDKDSYKYYTKGVMQLKRTRDGTSEKVTLKGFPRPWWCFWGTAGIEWPTKACGYQRKVIVRVWQWRNYSGIAVVLAGGTWWLCVVWNIKNSTVSFYLHIFVSCQNTQASLS